MRSYLNHVNAAQRRKEHLGIADSQTALIVVPAVEVDGDVNVWRDRADRFDVAVDPAGQSFGAEPVEVMVPQQSITLLLICRPLKFSSGVACGQRLAPSF